MSKITLGQAAKAGFASRAQIYRDAAGGKLAIEVQGDRKIVDLAELLRVYGDPGAPSPPRRSWPRLTYPRASSWRGRSRSWRRRRRQSRPSCGPSGPRRGTLRLPLPLTEPS